MGDAQVSLKITKILIVLEIILIFVTLFCFYWLQNVIVGIYNIVAIATIFLWIILIVLTVNLYNKAKVQTEFQSETKMGMKIPENERHKFAQPLGQLLEGSRQETIPQVELIIKEYQERNFTIVCYLVGDIVTIDFLSNNFLRDFIRLCIVDEKTQREEIKIDVIEFFEKIIEFENPKGTINPKSFNLLETLVKSQQRILFKVTKGEEDLLVLPLVLALPTNSKIKTLVFYGQPPVTDSKFGIPEGIVMVDVNKRIQERVKKFISIMRTT